jgi:hypothetical protein
MVMSNKSIHNWSPSTTYTSSRLFGPGLDHIFIRVGPAPPTPPSLPGLPHAPYPHMRGNSSSFGTDLAIKCISNNKYSSWHHFHDSQVNWWSSFTCQRSLMALKWSGIMNIFYFYITLLSHLFPMRKSSHRRCGHGAWERPNNEGGVGGARSSPMKTWPSPGRHYVSHHGQRPCYAKYNLLAKATCNWKCATLNTTFSVTCYS